MCRQRRPTSSQVERELWENVRYHFDETEKKIVEEQIGTYIQYPLKLALGYYHPQKPRTDLPTS